MNEIKLKVDADVSNDAKWVLNRQERMEQQRLQFIGDLFKYTANLVLSYDQDIVDAKEETEE